MQEAPSFVNVANVCFVTFIIQHYRIQGAFLLCKITNLLIYSKENSNGLGLYIVSNILNNYNIEYKALQDEEFFIFKIKIFS